MKRCKVLCAIDSMTGGGAEHVMAHVVNSLDPARFEVQLVLTLNSELRHAIGRGIRVVSLQDPVPPDVSFMPPTLWGRRCERVVLALLSLVARPAPHEREHLQSDVRVFRVASTLFARQVAATQPDCIVSFLPNTNVIALIAQARHRFATPVLCADRNFLSLEIGGLSWPRLRRFVTRRLYPRAAGHIAVSAAAGEDLHAQFGVARSAITVIPNGVDGARVRELARAAPPAGLGAADELRIAAIGRLHRQKGFDVLLDALARVGGRRWRLLLLGEGPEGEALREQARRLGIADRVVFAGWDPNPYRWLAAADLFVLSSRWEGMPNVLLEAMTLGLPVIATACPSGPAEILEGGTHGRLVPVESVDALAGAIAEFAADPALRRRQAALAERRAGHYSLERMVEGYERVILAATRRARDVRA